MENLAYQEDWDEIFGGKVVLMSPRPSVNHNRVSGNIYRIFANYLQGKTCEAFGDGIDLYLSEKNRFVPDGMIVCNPSFVKKDGVYGTPDLVVEVLSPSTAKNDRKLKKDAYEASGVGEYWIVEPETKSIEVYLLKESKFFLEEVYSLYPDYLLKKIAEEEQKKIVTSFYCSLFNDLEILLNDVFYGVLE